jgi:hypothetical protein
VKRAKDRETSGFSSVTHLSKHDTDRGTYMEEFRLTPDKLIVKDFRMIQSSRRAYFPRQQSSNG